MMYSGYIVYMLNGSPEEVSLNEITIDDFIVEFGNVNDIIAISLHLTLK